MRAVSEPGLGGRAAENVGDGLTAACFGLREPRRASN